MRGFCGAGRSRVPCSRFYNPESESKNQVKRSASPEGKKQNSHSGLPPTLPPLPPLLPRQKE